MALLCGVSSLSGLGDEVFSFRMRMGFVLGVGGLFLVGMKIGFISGTSISKSQVFSDWSDLRVETRWGTVTAKGRGDAVAINRHGFDRALPPHAINYRANVEALCQLNLKEVVTLSSVGSLDPDLRPGSLVSCSDYMSFAPKTFIDDRMSAFAPVIDNRHLDAIAAVSPISIARDKIYIQTPGPRFETRAEVRALQAWGADVVGMTLANEADLLLECGLSVTSFCMADNFAHGVANQRLSEEEFLRLVADNQSVVDAFLETVVEYCLS